MLRIVHALATEAERRGYGVACVNTREDSYGRSEWKPSQDGQLAFTLNRHQLKVRIWEKGAGLRGSYDRQMRRWHEDREQPVRLMQFVERPKPYDRGATGELNIEALAWTNGRQSRWGDRRRWTLEDRLPQLMRELETQAVEAEERRLAKEREEAERQRQWQVAIDQAKGCLVKTTGSMCCARQCTPGRKQRPSAPTATQLKHATARGPSPMLEQPSGSRSHVSTPTVSSSCRECPPIRKSAPRR